MPKRIELSSREEMDQKLGRGMEGMEVRRAVE